MLKLIMISLLFVAFATPAQAAPPQIGDTVWAQWTPNAWFHGKIDKACDWGLHVQFDDGDTGCFPTALLVSDKPAPAARIVPGARVLAKWSDGRYYPATVTGKAQAGQVPVFFDDRTPYSAAIADILAW